ncbi:hypothetical protein NQZ71_21765 (plasmid) [Niallia taxi]|uniref:hypothetical protein n=1 Tax=Niallia taxi TaxID=2499688 RepID=UPI002934F2B7|nr:hypothetical protein [Niallia taxi]WOD65822.1 hypothetical protein NQZ71_21765 [Niallia taxi]
MLGIKSYNPKLYTELSQIIKDQKIRLHGLKGKMIKDILVAWEEYSDEWFNDLPVIIRFEDCQLELCAYKSGEYAITFDQIDLAEEIDYYGTDFLLRWEQNKLMQLAEFINKRIDKVEIIECFEQLTGVGLHLEEGYLAVCNGLDENVIYINRVEGAQYKFTEL